MSTTGHQPKLSHVLRAALEAAVAVSMLCGIAVAPSACAGGGWPMSVEQRYSEPKGPDELLQDKVEAAKRAERAHGGAGAH
jgi:hypothetical protein